MAEGHLNRRLFNAASDLGAACAGRALTGLGATVFAPKRFGREQCRPQRRSGRAINVCERTDEPWRLPAELMCRVQREKTWQSRAGADVTVAVPGPKRKSWSSYFAAQKGETAWWLGTVSQFRVRMRP